MARHQDATTTDPSFAANEDRLVQLRIKTERLEHSSRRIGMLLKALFGLFWVVVIVAICAMGWRASQWRGVVVDSFEMDPALRKGGISGDLVASRVRIRLVAMRDATGSSSNPRAHTLFLEDWLDNYRLEIPQTQITLNELNRGLRQWLGDETRVYGLVTPAGNRLALRLRSKGWPTDLTADNLDQLIDRAAERIYRDTAPYLFGSYLAGFEARQSDSTRVFAEIAASGGEAIDRAWALNGLANNLIDFEARCADALVILDHARQLRPDLPNIHGNLRSAHHCLGNEQAAADASQRELDLLLSLSLRNSDLLNPDHVESIVLQDKDNLAANYGAYRQRLALYDRMEEVDEDDQSLARAEALARLRDVGGSRRVLRRWFAIQRPQGQADPIQQAALWNALAAQAWALEDWGRAAAHLGRVDSINRERGPYYVAHLKVESDPLRAIALARSGQRARGAQIAMGLPNNCYSCVRAQAAVAEALGLSRAADTFFRHAVALGPRLPFAYHEWGEAWLARRDAAAALDRFDQAITFGPEFADAHKGRGDALRSLGRFEEAERSYREAARRAPRWGALNMAWAQALWRLGRRDDARARLVAAAGMDLSRHDLARLRAMLNVARRFA